MKNFLWFFMMLCAVSVIGKEADSGQAEGLLIAKGASGEFIEFIADNSDKAVKYIPEWVGEAPAKVGGLKKETVEKIKKAIVPNRILLQWKMQEHLRVVDFTILEPKQKDGEASGVVVKVGENWFDLKITEGDKFHIERFMPKWVGGAPKDGGGLDKELLKEIKELKMESKITIKWIYDERKRVTKIALILE